MKQQKLPFKNVKEKVTVRYFSDDVFIKEEVVERKVFMRRNGRYGTADGLTCHRNDQNEWVCEIRCYRVAATTFADILKGMGLNP